MMKYLRIYLVFFIGLGVLALGSCKKDEVQTPADYVKELPHDADIIGSWIGFVDVKFTSVGGEIILDVTDTSTIYPAISKYNSDGSDFSYSLKRENGHYIHSYDPNTKNSMNFWYSGVSGKQKTVYNVFAQEGAAPSTNVDFDYEVYNTDTLIVVDYSSNEKRLIVRVADPSNIPSTLKIKE